MNRRNFFGNLFAAGAATVVKPEPVVVPPTPPTPEPQQVMVTVRGKDLMLALKRHDRVHKEYIQGLNGETIEV